jgi:hypothetical protein
MKQENTTQETGHGSAPCSSAIGSKEPMSVETSPILSTEELAGLPHTRGWFLTPTKNQDGAHPLKAGVK